MRLSIWGMRMRQLGVGLAMLVLGVTALARLHPPAVGPASAQAAETTVNRVGKAGSHANASGMVPTLPALPGLRMRPPQSHEPCVIEGIVRDSVGRPVPKAFVNGYDLGGSRRRYDPIHPAFVTTITFRADDEGKFQMQVSPGDYAIHASDRERSSAMLEPITVAPGETVAGLELTLTGSAWLRGRVVAADGAPTSASIGVFRPGETVEIVSLYAEEDGHFEVGSMPDGPLELVASRLGYRASLKIDHPASDLVLRMPADQRNIVVTVVDTHGSPVKDAEVVVSSGRLDLSMPTDDDGKVEVHLDGSEIVVSACSDDAKADEQRIQLAADGPREVAVKMVLKPRASLTGRVLAGNGDAATGYVQVRRLDGARGDRVSWVELDETGHYKAPRLDPGRYEVRYSEEEEEATVDEEPVLLATIGGTEAMQAADLRVLGERLIRGLVLDERGNPLPNAELELVDRGETSFISADSITSDQNGRFELVVRGPTHIRAVFEQQQSAVMNLVGAGNEDVRLTVQASAVVVGRLRGNFSDATEVRCAGGLWHDVEQSGEYNLNCSAGTELEVRTGDEVRRFPVDIEPNDFTYTELRL